MTPADAAVLLQKRAFFSQLDIADKLDAQDSGLDAGYEASVAALSDFERRCEEARLQDLTPVTHVPAEKLKIAGSNVARPANPRRSGTPLSSWIPAARPLPRTVSFAGEKREEERIAALEALQARSKKGVPERPEVDDAEVVVIHDTQPLATEPINANHQHLVATETHAPPSQYAESVHPVVEIAQAAPQLPDAVARGRKGKNTSVKSTPISTIGKRKRDSEPERAPLAQQVFKGLFMMFLPNNAINKARAMRIRKVIEYGAERALKFDSQVTHIIADKDIPMQDVLKYLNRETLPKNLIVVKENYTADCITWRALMDPLQPRYRLKGAEPIAAPATIQGPSNSAPSERSLQLKPEKGAKNHGDGTAGTHTPSRTDESSVRIISPARAATPRASISRSTSPEVIKSSTVVQQKAALEATDALDEAIVTAKATAHLPLSDDDEPSRPGSSGSSSEVANSEFEDDRGSPGPSKGPRIGNKGTNDPTKWEKTFQCMQSQSTNDADNPNARTIAILQEMETYYYSVRDQWRCRAYRQAIGQLRKQKHRITSKEEAGALNFIGARLAAKIEEIVWTDRLQRLENAKLEPTDHVVGTFVKIYGVGFTQASKWVQEGHHSLEDLLTSPTVRLTDNQRVGIAHYDDFQLRIPRPETRLLGEIIRSALAVVDPSLQMVIGGSYRRGAPDSGDIDVIITAPGADATSLRRVTIDKLVPYLTRAGFLTAALAVTSRTDGSKWHGACQLPSGPDPQLVSPTRPNDPAKNTNPWRRIDFLLVPWDEMGAAMIYFTGNDIFNRSLRLLAQKKGMRLNQRGLYEDVLRKGTKRLSEGTKISGHSEKEIFEILGVPWRDARSRDC